MNNEESQDKKSLSRKIYCKDCQRTTNHTILFKKNRFEEWPDGEATSTTYYCLQCNGCESVCFVEEYSYSEDFDEFGKPEVRVTIYPDPFNDRQAIKGKEHLPTMVYRIYTEVLQALNAKAYILAGVGLRSLVEAICHDKGVKPKRLEKKIDFLTESRLLSKTEADFLHLCRYMGNAAAHELSKPQIEELEAGLGIIENLLSKLYILPEIAKVIRTGLPKTDKIKTGKT